MSFKTTWKALDAQGRDAVSVTKTTPKVYEVDGISTAGKWQIAAESPDVGSKRTISVIYEAISDSGNIIQQDVKFKVEEPNTIMAVDFDVALWQTPFKIRMKVKTSYDKAPLKFRAVVRQQVSSAHADETEDHAVRKATTSVHTKKTRTASTSGDSSKKSSHRSSSKHDDTSSNSSTSSSHKSGHSHSHSESKKDTGGDLLSFLDPLGSSAPSTTPQAVKMANGSTHLPASRGASAFPGLGFVGGGGMPVGTPQSAGFPGLMGGGGGGGGGGGMASSAIPRQPQQQPQQQSFDGLLGQVSSSSSSGSEPAKRGDIMSLFNQPGAKADPFANLKI